jgi:hypothetical protein
MPNWLIPWIVVAIIIWPLRQLEGWMHKHIQGLGLLITNNPQAAVLVYYLLLLPGVVLHEGSQWVLAKLLRVKVKKFRLWPEKQRGGVIRLGLVEIDSNIDTFRETLVGIVPLVTGVAVIALIGSLRFDTSVLMAAVATGDLPTIFAGISAFVSTPDFWLWVYLVFSIANAMMPEEHDEINWWMIAGALAAVTVFLLVLDLGILLQAGLEGPFAQIARWLSLAFVISLVIDLLVMGIISLMEVIFSRVLGRELEYS